MNEKKIKKEIQKYIREEIYSCNYLIDLYPELKNYRIKSETRLKIGKTKIVKEEIYKIINDSNDKIIFDEYVKDCKKRKEKKKLLDKIFKNNNNNNNNNNNINNNNNNNIIT